MEKENGRLEKIRHSLAHLMAAVITGKHPEVKLGIGPTIENGFYYDFDFSAVDHSPTEEKLPILEGFVKELIKQDIKFEKEEISAKKAREIFADQPFKLELIDELEKSGQKISIYKSGNLVDLCAGPHVNSSKEINPDAFRLTKVAGAYWKGSEKNKMLTRIYGVAFETKEELDAYLKMMEEAEKRDHRKLGKELELFMISEEVGKGLPLWLPNGAFIRRKMEDYMYQKELEKGYKYVYTPILAHKKLYETSGHLAHYKEDMYSPLDIEGEEYYLKPMNCPHHHMIYKHGQISYKDLPLRLAEFGLVHRFERSGVLTGLIRARAFTQNDSHIYCQKNQLKSELIEVLKLFKEVYNDFHIEDFWYRLSLPDFKNEEKYGDIKDKKVWEEAAKMAEDALKEFGAKYIKAEGEASFYGPKIDVQTKNVLGKEDTIATVQVDFYSAKKFDLNFINEKGEKEHPVIIHRAIFGSFDRTFAFLTERTGGNFPVWLSPVQVLILPVGEKFNDYGNKVLAELKNAGIRAEMDMSAETLGKKIRAGKTRKIPYLLVVGEKEKEAGTVAVNFRGQEKQETLSVEQFIKLVQKEIEEKK
ncbi:MAG: threonine--tRNA ligase [Candidatus Pacebacteria bacterium]|nr:threonine--tRNA ligase [Candidatus Paceibacterota bacterium]NUQ57258.1 threonine--tRNA ligase [Candidatus Paceibacter sp.]